MDVLILESDDLVAEVLADVLADEGLTASVMATEQEAEAIPPHAPRKSSLPESIDSLVPRNRSQLGNGVQPPRQPDI
jgi:hypothetical protein